MLVDPANRYLREVVAPEWWADVQRQRLTGVDPAGPEVADFDTSVDAIVAAALPPSVPAVVLTSDAAEPSMIDKEHFPDWVRSNGLLAAELGARHVTKTNSGHNIQVEQPDLVTRAIEDVMAAAPRR